MLITSSTIISLKIGIRFRELLLMAIENQSVGSRNLVSTLTRSNIFSTEILHEAEEMWDRQGAPHTHPHHHHMMNNHRLVMQCPQMKNLNMI